MADSHQPDRGHRTSLRRRILFTILPAALLAVIGLALWNYLEARREARLDFQVAQNNSEAEITNALLLMDAGYRMLENRLEKEMRAYLPMLLQAYEKAGRDPARMDLAALKRRLGKHLDIYIIDADAIVRRTTASSGLGFDFKTYGLGKAIQVIRTGHDVANERVRTNILSGMLGDWIYVPTPDHRFVIEIGYGGSKELDRIASALDPIAVAKQLEQLSPYVDSVKIYDVFGYEFGHTGAAKYAPSRKLQARIKQVIRQGKMVIDKQDTVTVYRYVDLASVKKSVSNPSKIVRIRFTRAPILARLHSLARTSLAVVLLFTLILTGVILLLSRRLTQPLQKLHDTARAVANGDLSQRAEVLTRDETGELAVTFNQVLERVVTDETRLERSVEVRTAALVRAIKAREKAEKDKLRLQEVALRAKHMEGLSKVAGGVAHQFNNIMHGIMGYAELMSLASKDLPGDMRDYCDAITSSVERGAKLTRHLLAYTGQGKTDIRTIHPPELLESEQDIFTAGLPVSARLDIDCHADTPAITIDEGQFRQMLLVLISNAGKAVAPAGNAIRIQTAPARLDDTDIQRLRIHEHMLPGDHLRLTVEDNGCGMDAVTQSQMFDPFFTTIPTDAGLGLSALLGVVQGLHGGIDVHSAPGEGTRISIYLPATQHPAAEQLAPPSPPPRQEGVQTVLVADDNPASLAVAEAMLERCGFTAITATDGNEAIQMFQQHRDRIGGVILDMKMPALNGDEAFIRIRDMDKHVPVWICSGFEEERIASRLYEQNLTGFIAKPYHLADLSKAIRQHLPCETQPADQPDPPRA